MSGEVAILCVWVGRQAGVPDCVSEHRVIASANPEDAIPLTTIPRCWALQTRRSGYKQGGRRLGLPVRARGRRQARTSATDRRLPVSPAWAGNSVRQTTGNNGKTGLPDLPLSHRIARVGSTRLWAPPRLPPRQRHIGSRAPEAIPSADEPRAGDLSPGSPWHGIVAADGRPRPSCCRSSRRQSEARHCRLACHSPWQAWQAWLELQKPGLPGPWQTG